MSSKHLLQCVQAFILILSMSACVSDSVPNQTPLNTSVQVHAHRGGAALKPENSLEAFKTAVTEVGVDSIELDIHQTLDNVLIVNHNPQINPAFCLNPDGSTITSPPTITSMTSAEVMAYDCGTLVGLPRHTPLATLDEVFQMVEGLKPLNGKSIQYTLHVKWDATTIGATDYANLILGVIQKYGVHDRLHFMNDSWTLVQTVRSLDPTVQLYYLVQQVQPGDLENAEAVGLSAIVPLGQYVGPELVQSFHAQGIQVIPWTINIPYDWQSLINTGVDGIITDNPIGLNQLLGGNLTNQEVIGPAGD